MDPDFDKIVLDTICYDNGDYYEGQVIGRLPHGEGTMFYIDGNTITCKWIYGTPVIGKRDERIPGEGSERDRVIINNHTLYVGYAYDNDTLVSIFKISRFIRGIRLHDDRAVLLSTGQGVYKDGSGWELDPEGGEPIFVYTGEGLQGDQELTFGNRFLKYSLGKEVYLFVKRKKNEYVFNGQVVVKRTETAMEPDAANHMRMVYKFILGKV